MDDRTWVEALTGGTVTTFDRTTTGRSRATWLVEVERAEGPLSLVLRRDTGDGPLSGTELSLAREQAVYRALAGTGVRIPALWGAADDGSALLVERIRGVDDVGVAEPDARAKVLDGFADALAALHSVPVADLDLPGFHRPVDGPDHALGELALWGRIFSGFVDRPAPIVRLALRWLEANPPAHVERTVLCHGDAGPGNFLYDGTEVTALLDWEFAHLGDPMDDLAWFTVRASQVAGLDDVGPIVARYAAAAGVTVDPARVAYYQTFVLTRMAIACLVALGKPVGTMDVSTYHMLVPLLERQIVGRLAEALGVELEAPEPLEPMPPSPRASVLAALGADLGNHLLSELQTEAARSRAMGMTLLLMHLQAADGMAAPIAAADEADLREVLGAGAPPTVDALDDVVATAPVAEWPRLVQALGRRAERALALWPMVAGLAGRELPQVGP